MDVKIEKLVYGGEGLAHHDGATIFVPFVLPGEVVAVEPIERKKKFVRGRLQQLIAPSPERAAAPCPHFTVCGGCHYQHISYPAQLSYKVEILRETLWRIGKVQWEGPIQAHPSPPFGYRNRAQWKARPVGGRLGIGYFQASSSALCAVDECRVLSSQLEETLAALRRLGVEGHLPATLREIEAFASGDGEILLNASLADFTTAPATLAETLRHALPGVESILLHESSRDRMELFGPGFLHYAAAGARYRVGHLSFFQANRFLIDELAQALAADSQGRLALDLFAGVGLFTIPLARRFERVVAVESNPAAAGDLKANIESSGGVAQAVNEDVETFLRHWTEPPDWVALDPPRSGVPAGALERLAQLAPECITYVSCDPATLARDLAVLTRPDEPSRATYALSELHLFDIFPQTFHIESLARLRRR